MSLPTIKPEHTASNEDNIPSYFWLQKKKKSNQMTQFVTVSNIQTQKPSMIEGSKAKLK